MNQMENVLVSVIIPVFNVEPFFAKALDSVIWQSYKNLEIIIIDDGSTDGSEKICDKYAEKDDRIIVVHQDNKGLSAARNVGLDILTGDVVAFLDADDAYHRDFIKKMIAVMFSEGADIVDCRFVVKQTIDSLIVEKDEIKEARVFCFDHLTALRALVDGRVGVNVWNKTYRCNLWNDIRFPNGCVYEDIDTTYRVINECKKVCLLDEVLYIQRNRRGSISNTYSLNNIHDWSRAMSHMEAFIKENTPEIFSSKHINKYQRARFNGLIPFYISLSSSNDIEERKNAEELRKIIIETGREICNSNNNLRTKVTFWTICNFPIALKFVFQVYEPFIRSVRRVLLKFKYNINCR